MTRARTAPTAARRRCSASSRCSRLTAARSKAAVETLRSAAAGTEAVAAAATDELTLAAYGDLAAGCTRCALAEGRTQVVFGAGSPTADLMFVGEAPGFHEDKQGVPFVGAAGQLLGKLLAGIGLARDDVYIANVAQVPPSRATATRCPTRSRPARATSSEQIELIRPKVVATLGNFSTKLLSGSPLGITRVHGQEQDVTLGGSRCCSTRSSIPRLRSTRRGCSTCSRPTSGGCPSCSAGPRHRPLRSSPGASGARRGARHG